ncbi:MAG: PTS sugar transporter subunit IIA [Treponema sp.]|nr:PTS sugar transporter subunit IIA [Treponema sp.]
MILGQVFTPKAIIVDLESTDKDELFEEMVESAVSVQPQLDRQEALKALLDREAKMSTGIIPGIAVPHGICKSVKGIQGVIGISRKGIDYEALDNNPVHLVFMLIIAPDDRERHVQVLKTLSEVLQNSAFSKTIVEKTSAQEVYDVICTFEAALNQ